MPTQDKLRTLADLLNVSIAWLRDGDGKESADVAAHDAVKLAYRADLSEQELIRRFRKLSDRQQQAVAEIISVLAIKDTRRGS